MRKIEEVDQTTEIKHVNDLWKKSNEASVIVDLKNGLSLQDIIDKQKIIKPLAEPNKMVCADGRCQHNEETFCLAGSGILLPDEDFKQIIKDHGNIKCLTSHDGCGAGKLAFENFKSQGGILPENVLTADEFAKWWTKSKALEYGLDYEHIGAEKFNDPNHHERGLLINSITFNPELIKGLPNVFVSDLASCSKDDNVAKEISILTSIAFSDHGFGSRIKEQEPFYIFICAKNKTDQSRLTKITEAAVSNYGTKVRIEGFFSPY